MNKFKIYALALFGALLVALGVLLYHGGEDVAPAPETAPELAPSSVPESDTDGSDSEPPAPRPACR